MKKGFDSDTFDSQAVFRNVLTAMANPGRIVDMGVDLCPPEVLHQASGVILLTLLDYETPFWCDLDTASEAARWVTFHTGAPGIQAKKQSAFALYTDYDNLDDPGTFNMGTIASPDCSTTLIVQTRGIDNKGRIRMTGPGIQKECFLKLKGIKEGFLRKRMALSSHYPLGVDMIFVCDRVLVAVPRTTRLEIL